MQLIFNLFSKFIVLTISICVFSNVMAYEEPQYSVIQSNNGDVTKLFDTLNQFISKWLYKINCGRKIKNFKKS